MAFLLANWRVLALLALLAGTFWSGWSVKAWKVDADALKEVKAAVATGVTLQQGATQAEANALDRMRTLKEVSDGRAKALQQVLNESDRQLATCRVDSRTISVLNRTDQGPGPAGTPPGDKPAAPGVEGGSTCAAVVETFDENHGRYDLTRAQLQACVVFYKETREKYCKATGAC